MTKPTRRRGRPAAGSASDTRAAILAAARSQFAARGFTGASMRSIAKEAGVDASLISHYFGDKAQLLVATMELPINPLEKVQGVLAGGLDGMGERLIATFLGAWDPHRDVFSTMVRSTLGSQDPHATPVFQLAQNVVVAGLRERMTEADADVRAPLIASQIVGLALMRYVLRLEPVASAPAEEVARTYGAAVQAILTPGR
jgi:AcrR family transcriptional regulator